MNIEEKDKKIYGFVGSKINLLQRKDPWSKGMLAKLRRGVGKSPFEIGEIWEITLSGLPEEFLCREGSTSATEAEWAIHTSLTLYAMHQQGNDQPMSMGKNEGGLSFGSAIKRLINTDGTNEDSIKRRFNSVITSTDLKELSYHGRGLIQLMRSEAIPIRMDYPQFAVELYRFQFEGMKNGVRLQWGQDFYKTGEKKNKKKDSE